MKGGISMDKIFDIELLEGEEISEETEEEFSNGKGNPEEAGNE